MKNLFTILLIAFISLNVKASDTKWELAANVDNWDSYFSNSMISENNDSIWILRNYQNEIHLGIDPVTGKVWYPHRSVKVTFDVECDTGRIGLRAWKLFSGSKGTGEVVWADTDHGYPAKYVAQTTDEKLAVEKVCGSITAKYQ